MTTQSLPFRKRFSRGPNRGINICGRSLGDRSNLLARGWIDRIDIHSFHRLPPCSVYKVTEAASMTVQPHQRLFRVLGRWPVFHGDEFLSNAHGSKKIRRSDAGNQPNSARSRGAPTAAQYRPAIHSRLNGTVPPSSKACPALLSSATATPAIASQCEFRPRV